MQTIYGNPCKPITIGRFNHPITTPTITTASTVKKDGCFHSQDNANDPDILEVHVPSRYVSRVHALLFCHKGTYFLKVVGSNGLKINGTLFPPKNVVELRHRDVLNFVGTKFLFSSLSDPSIVNNTAVEISNSNYLGVVPGLPHFLSFSLLQNQPVDHEGSSGSATAVPSSEIDILCQSDNSLSPLPESLYPYSNSNSNSNSYPHSYPYPLSSSLPMPSPINHFKHVPISYTNTGAIPERKAKAKAKPSAKTEIQTKTSRNLSTSATSIDTIKPNRKTSPQNISFTNVLSPVMCSAQNLHFNLNTSTNTKVNTNVNDTHKDMPFVGSVKKQVRLMAAPASRPKKDPTKHKHKSNSISNSSSNSKFKFNSLPFADAASNLGNNTFPNDITKLSPSPSVSPNTKAKAKTRAAPKNKALAKTTSITKNQSKKQAGGSDICLQLPQTKKMKFMMMLDLPPSSPPQTDYDYDDSHSDNGIFGDSRASGHLCPDGTDYYDNDNDNDNDQDQNQGYDQDHDQTSSSLGTLADNYSFGSGLEDNLGSSSQAHSLYSDKNNSTAIWPSCNSNSKSSIKSLYKTKSRKIKKELEVLSGFSSADTVMDRDLEINLDIDGVLDPAVAGSKPIIGLDAGGSSTRPLAGPTKPVSLAPLTQGLLTNTATTAQEEEEEEEEEEEDHEKIESATNTIILYMATHKKTKITISQVARQLAMPRSLASQVLTQSRCFGKLKRTKLDADNVKVEDFFYYVPENDTDSLRQLTFQPIVRKSRKCTLIDPQYYFKPIKS